MSHRIQTIASALTLTFTFTLTAPTVAQAADAMRVVRDPLTGEMRAPNAAESAAFEKAEAQLRLRSGKPVVQPAEVRYPDGTIETKLGDDTMMYAVVASAADGSLTFDCLPAKATQKLMLSKKTSSVTTASKVGHVHKY